MPAQPKEQVKNWREKRKRKEIRTSATQHETFELCARKWWLDKVRGLGEFETRQSLIFGSVLHAVCERYLTADDLGRDENGNEVDLYPKGWHRSVNKFTGELEGEIGLDEQDLVKALISKAIEQGVLERRPGRLVEHSFRQPIVEVNGVNVQVEGFIDLDYLADGEIDDHKTSKSPRYFKSARALGENLQMLIYANNQLKRMEEQGIPMPEFFTFRHNQYCTDPKNPIVRKTEVQVPVETVQTQWEQRVVANAREMERIRREAETWSDIPEPRNMAESCNAYGGCPFRRICQGIESEETYEKRLEAKSKGEYVSLSIDESMYVKPQLGESPMSELSKRLDALKARNSAAETATVATTPRPSINPPSPPAQAPAQAVAAPSQQAPAAPAQAVAAGSNLSDLGEWEGNRLSLPPWVDPNDLTKINDGLGFNAEGAPDRVAAVKAKAKGRPVPDMFDLDTVGEGIVMWVGKTGTPAEGMEGFSPLSLNAVTREVKAQTRTAPAPAPQPAPEPAPAQQAPTPSPAPAPAPQPAPEPESEEEETVPTLSIEEPKKPGRPKRAFILCINVAAQPGSNFENPGSGRGVIDLNSFLLRIQQNVLDNLNSSGSKQFECYEEIDPFRRKDAVASYARSLAEQFKSDFVVANGVSNGTEIKALVDALRPYAGIVFMAAAS